MGGRGRDGRLGDQGGGRDRQGPWKVKWTLEMVWVDRRERTTRRDPQGIWLVDGQLWRKGQGFGCGGCHSRVAKFSVPGRWMSAGFGAAVTWERWAYRRRINVKAR